MKVLVTGAAGFVGLNIVKALKEEGHEPFAYARSSSNLQYLNQLGVPALPGDILEPEALHRAAKGMGAIIHCAGNTSGFKKDRASVWSTNVEGTKNVIDAAMRANVSRLVFTSSTATIGTREDGQPADEATPLWGYRANSAYAKSKIEAERLLNLARTKGLPVIFLAPAEVLGAFDYRFQWGTVVKMIAEQNLPFMPMGGASFCHAQEVGRMHAVALTKGRIGEKYCLAGTDLELPLFIEKIGEVLHKPIPAVGAMMRKGWLLRSVFGVQELLHGVTGKLPPLDQIRIRAFYDKLYFSSKKAERELGFKSYSIERMIEACYKWYLENKLLG